MPVPKGVLQTDEWQECPFARWEYVPVVFITNRTFEQLPEEWCDTLATKITNRIWAVTAQLEKAAATRFLYDSLRFEGGVNSRGYDSLMTIVQQSRAQACMELQIDCDWTAGTRDKYFRFLRKFRALNQKQQVSATVRLYPYKYREKLGVPPVNRAMLMCYNMGKVTAPGTRNSILDISILKQYFTGEPYPLPVDVALPAFGWYAWFRASKYEGIVHEDEQFIADTALFRKEGGNNYRVAADTVIDDNYYREGDVLRHELPSAADIEAAADIVLKREPSAGTITFFDWNEHAITTYGKAIHAVFDRH